MVALDTYGLFAKEVDPPEFSWSTNEGIMG